MHVKILISCVSQTRLVHKTEIWSTGPDLLTISQYNSMTIAVISGFKAQVFCWLNAAMSTILLDTVSNLKISSIVDCSFT